MLIYRRLTTLSVQIDKQHLLTVTEKVNAQCTDSITEPTMFKTGVLYWIATKFPVAYSLQQNNTLVIVTCN